VPRIRIALAAAALIATSAGVGLPASAGTQATPKTPRLAGVTTFTAAHSARAMVRLTKSVPVTMDEQFFGISGLSFEGDGRIVGVVVTSPNGRTGVVQFRLRTCFTAGCHRSTYDDPDDNFGFTWGGQQSWGPDAPPFHLAPGLYQVSVYTDGDPVTVTWRLPTLHGRTHVAVHLAQRAAVMSPPERGVGGTPQSPAWSQSMAGYSLRTNITVLAVVHRVSGGPHVHSESDWCTYKDSEPPNGEITPGCPGGDDFAFGSTYVTTDNNSGSAGISLWIGSGSAGHYIQGMDEYGAQVATDVHDTYFFADAGIPKQ
jgi:hypothetical protein